MNERYTCTVIAPARDSGKPPAIHEEPLKNLVAPINGPFTECLKRNKQKMINRLKIKPNKLKFKLTC